MVEFGLKLEDNKVDEWSSEYIDYEKLKAVLKRAKASTQYRDELLKKMPPGVAAGILQERRDRLRTSALRDSKRPRDVDSVEENKPLKMGPDPLEVSSKGSSSSLPAADVATDTTPLLASHDDSLKKRTHSWTNLHQVVFSYLGFDDNKLFLKAYDDADEKLNLFKRSYEQEVNKVKIFYEAKTQEVSQRIEVLGESVSTAHVDIKNRKQKKRGSIVNSIAQRFESMLHGSLPPLNESDRRDSSVPDMDLEVSEPLDAEGTGHRPADEFDTKKKDEQLARNSGSIKRAITDIYRTAKLLHNFSIMNYTGFVKIAKKFDKTFPEHKGTFKGINCEDGKQAEVLAAKMERIYSKWFCDGDIKEAQAQMLTKKGDGLMMDWSQLRLGYRLGMCTILAMWVAWDCVWGQIADGNVSIGGRSAFPVFRGIFGLLVWHWFWGMAVYVWTRYRINYIYLFEFDPRNVDTPINIFNAAVDETLVFLICMLMYYKSDSGDMPLWIPPRAYPSFLILYTMKCLIFPWKTRLPLWVGMKQVIMAPFTSPTFFHTYIGDVFTSMVKMFQDLLWTVCFVASGDFLLSEVEHEEGDHNVHAWTEQFWYKNVAIPLVCLLPLWIRFNQCLRRYLDTGKRNPNLLNAFKYALSQSVTLFGAFHPLYLMHSRKDDIHAVSLGSNDDDGRERETIFIGKYQSNLFQLFWMGLFVSSSLYSFFWDVYMDWGLGRCEYGFLGPRLMFPKKSEYYMVICADLVMRFMWVLTLLPPDSGADFELPAYLSVISMTVELFRRIIWSFFRLEHEHRQNTEGFRRVNVVPLHFDHNHKHKYNQTTRIGWKVLIEIVIITSIVVAISAFSAIVAQKSARLELSRPTSHGGEI